MKRIFFLLLPTLLCAQPEFSGRVLYWKPFGTNVHYATTFRPLGAHDILQPNYHVGWGAEAAYLCECDRFSLSYDQVYAATNGQLNKPEIIDPQNQQPAFVKSTSNQRYLGSDLLWTRRFFKGYCFRIDLFGGIRFAALDERIRSQLLMRLTKFRGGGPALGLGTSFCWAEGFSVGAEISGSGLTGRRRYFNESDGIRSKGHETVILPNLNGRAFAKAAFRYMSCRWILAFGYEMRFFSCAFYRPQLNLPLANQLVGSDNMTLAGPYLSLAMRF